ncbi:MAG: pilin [Litorivicinaceae bacterium]
MITIAIQGTEVAALDAGSLVFEPSTSNQNLTWSCRASSSGLNQYVPADCRVTL